MNIQDPNSPQPEETKRRRGRPLKDRSNEPPKPPKVPKKRGRPAIKKPTETVEPQPTPTQVTEQIQPKDETIQPVGETPTSQGIGSTGTETPVLDRSSGTGIEEPLQGTELIRKLIQEQGTGADVPMALVRHSTGGDLWEECQFQGQDSGSALYRFMSRVTEHERNKHLFEEPEKVEDILQRHNIEKYAFQMERGELTEKRHFQMYFKLKQKVRAKQLAKTLNHELFGIEVQPAVANEMACYNYVIKEDTRIQGPWSRPSNLQWSRRSRSGTESVPMADMDS